MNFMIIRASTAEFDDGKRYARMRIEEVQSDFEIAEGSGDVRGVAAGFKARMKQYSLAPIRWMIISSSPPSSGRSRKVFFPKEVPVAVGRSRAALPPCAPKLLFIRRG